MMQRLCSKWFRQQSRRQARPFTLVELLAVVAIILILAAITLKMVGFAMTKAKMAESQAQFRMLEHAIVAYRNQNGCFPPVTSRYLFEELKDATGAPYPTDPITKREVWVARGATIVAFCPEVTVNGVVVHNCIRVDSLPDLDMDKFGTSTFGFGQASVTAAKSNAGPGSGGDAEKGTVVSATGNSTTTNFSPDYPMQRYLVSASGSCFGFSYPGTMNATSFDIWTAGPDGNFGLSGGSSNPEAGSAEINAIIAGCINPPYVAAPVTPWPPSPTPSTPPGTQPSTIDPPWKYFKSNVGGSLSPRAKKTDDLGNWKRD